MIDTTGTCHLLISAKEKIENDDGDDEQRQQRQRQQEILDFMRRIRREGRGGEALWTAPTKREEIAK